MWFSDVKLFKKMANYKRRKKKDKNNNRTILTSATQDHINSINHHCNSGQHFGIPYNTTYCTTYCRQTSWERMVSRKATGQPMYTMIAMEIVSCNFPFLSANCRPALSTAKAAMPRMGIAKWRSEELVSLTDNLWMYSIATEKSYSNGDNLLDARVKKRFFTKTTIHGFA